MSQVEEEKYLTNRCKVERIKTKVKIRFKAQVRVGKRRRQEHLARSCIKSVPTNRSLEQKSSSPPPAPMMISRSGPNELAKHWTRLLWALLLISTATAAASMPTISDAVTLASYLPRPVQEASATATPMSRASKLTPIGNSELSFEYLNLKAIPSDQLCQLVDSESASPATSNQINLV